MNTVWVELVESDWTKRVTVTRWLRRKRIVWERRVPRVSERRETTLSLARSTNGAQRTNETDLVWPWSPDLGMVEWVGFRVFDAPEGGIMLFSGDVSFGMMAPGFTACVKRGDLTIAMGLLA